MSNPYSPGKVSITCANCRYTTVADADVAGSFLTVIISVPVTSWHTVPGRALRLDRRTVRARPAHKYTTRTGNAEYCAGAGPYGLGSRELPRLQSSWYLLIFAYGTIRTRGANAIGATMITAWRCRNFENKRKGD